MRNLLERAEVLKLRLNAAAIDVRRLVLVRRYLEENQPEMLPAYYSAISKKLSADVEEANILLEELARMPKEYLTPSILDIMQGHLDIVNAKRQVPK